ncbi:MAG: DUF4279 domain-containing protein [Chitinophagaceae bacterium]|nr:MAG: DUF4279 domain-containing protein [Chitinophagaceae bacterium]
MTDTKGYAYFTIKSEDAALTRAHFDALIPLAPTEFMQLGERGSVPKSTSWSYGTPQWVNPDCSVELERLVAQLQPHVPAFIAFKTQYPEVVLSLQVVLFLGDATPALGFSRAVLGFVHAVGAGIDCDIYNEK